TGPGARPGRWRAGHRAPRTSPRTAAARPHHARSAARLLRPHGAQPAQVSLLPMPCRAGSSTTVRVTPYTAVGSRSVHRQPRTVAAQAATLLLRLGGASAGVCLAPFAGRDDEGAPPWPGPDESFVGEDCDRAADSVAGQPVVLHQVGER